MDPLPAGTAAQFPNTRWTAILSLRESGDSVLGQQALRSLCETYWYPLYAFARQRGHSRPEAEDAVQEFFARVGDATFFQRADQEKGKLRTFILTAFTRMLAARHDHATAQKRGGGVPHVSLDVALAESWLEQEAVSDNSDPVLSFERHWAQTIMRTAIAALREEVHSSPKAAAKFEVLSRFLHPETCTSYTIASAAADLEMTVDAVTRAVHRLRQQFRTAVREQVAATLANPDAVTILEEMQQLQRALAG